MPDVVAKDDCKEKHEKLEVEVEKAIERATAAVESRIKIWILMAAFAILASLIYVLVDMGSYREKVLNNKVTIQKIEEIIDGLRFRSGGGEDRRAP